MLPMLRASTRHFLHLRVASQRSLATPLASSSAFINRQILQVAGRRRTHTFPSPTVYQPLPYNNWSQAVEYYVTPKRYARTLTLWGMPRFAIEEDVSQLFVESGFQPELILMVYRPNDGHPKSYHRSQALIVLSTSGEAQRALQELNGAPMFDRRIDLNPYQHYPRNFVDLSWGWYKTDSSQQSYVKQRAPWFTPPTNIFAPHREGRALIFENVPKWHPSILKDFYNLLYMFDVVDIKSLTVNRVSRTKLSGNLLPVIFGTSDQATEAQKMYDNHILQGYDMRLEVSFQKPPMRILGGVSWSGGRPGEHYSKRDQGSAVATNLESAEEELFRRWLLGGYDRGLWVPGHKY